MLLQPYICNHITLVLYGARFITLISTSKGSALLVTGAIKVTLGYGVVHVWVAMLSTGHTIGFLVC